MNAKETARHIVNVALKDESAVDTKISTVTLLIAIEMELERAYREGVSDATPTTHGEELRKSVAGCGDFS